MEILIVNSLKLLHYKSIKANNMTQESSHDYINVVNRFVDTIEHNETFTESKKHSLYAQFRCVINTQESPSCMKGSFIILLIPELKMYCSKLHRAIELISDAQGRKEIFRNLNEGINIAYPLTLDDIKIIQSLTDDKLSHFCVEKAKRYIFDIRKERYAYYEKIINEIVQGNEDLPKKILEEVMNDPFNYYAPRRIQELVEEIFLRTDISLNEFIDRLNTKLEYNVCNVCNTCNEGGKFDITRITQFISTLVNNGSEDIISYIKRMQFNLEGLDIDYQNKQGPYTISFISSVCNLFHDILLELWDDIFEFE